MLQFLRLAGVKAYGAASPAKHETVRALGATPIDSRFGLVDGTDLAFDGVGGPMTSRCISALRARGRLVAYGFVGRGVRLTIHCGDVRKHLRWLTAPRPLRKLLWHHGEYRKDASAFHEDLPKIFAVLAEKKIAPMIAQTVSLLDVRAALDALAAGGVAGKIVLEAQT